VFCCYSSKYQPHEFDSCMADIDKTSDFNPNLSWSGFSLPLMERTHVMGILNVTPDSFSDGGNYTDVNRAVDRALEMEAEGADIIDIGGESTRPGADPVDVKTEIERVVPVIQRLRGKLKAPISIDTRKSAVAVAALKAGAAMVNDVSGLRFDPAMAAAVSRFGVPVVIMHAQGEPKTMQKNPHYHDIIQEIREFLADGIRIAEKAGVPRDQIIIDPGIGFGKSVDDNFIILKNLEAFLDLKCPVMVGVSRKSFIGKTLDAGVDGRLFGTASAVAASILNGARIIRVHDVKAMKQVAGIADRIRGNAEEARQHHFRRDKA
jgi:dihydropteroate synthase